MPVHIDLLDKTKESNGKSSTKNEVAYSKGALGYSSLPFGLVVNRAHGEMRMKNPSRGEKKKIKTLREVCDWRVARESQSVQMGPHKATR